MKLIALKDFTRTPALKGLKIEGSVHDKHIHKGATFDIGAEDTLAELHENDKPAAFLVAQLTVAGCVGDATDENVLKAVKADIAQDKKREETYKKLQEKADGASLMNQLTALMQRAAATPAK